MISIFGKKGLKLLEAFAGTRTLYAFDFDGTLARIVRAPENARMAQSTEQLLQRLARLVPVAIVSGRSVADLRRRIGFSPAFLVGNHGIEGIGARKAALEHAARARGAARNTYEEAIRDLEPAPRVVEGKFVLNLLPPGVPHKGDAILDLQRRGGLKNLFYIGDDDTDEDVFGMRHQPVHSLMARVGRRDRSQAAFYIDRQSEIDRLLQLLIQLQENAVAGRRLLA